MLQIVRDVGSINLFRLVIDPREYGRSVENIFYLSCLFHDGVCGFHVNEDEEPVVSVLLFLKHILRSNVSKRLAIRLLIIIIRWTSNVTKWCSNLTCPPGGYVSPTERETSLKYVHLACNRSFRHHRGGYASPK